MLNPSPLSVLAAIVPGLTGADGVEPFDAEALASWAIRTGPGALRPGAMDAADTSATARARRYLSAGFVLAHVPEPDRGERARAVAWREPTDPTMTARLLAVSSPRDLAILTELFAAAWMDQARSPAEHVLRTMEPARLVRLLRLDAWQHRDDGSILVGCTVAGHRGHSCEVRADADGVVRFSCPGSTLDALQFVARSRGILATDAPAVLRALF